MEAKKNVYEIVTEKIVEKLNNGIIPWRKPWHGGFATGEDVAINYVTRKAYSPLNQFLLDEPGEYVSWKQATEHGGTIRKGAKSKIVVFYTKASYVKKNEETGEEEVITYPYLKYYNVFHIKDVEGLKSKIVPGEKIEQPETDATADAVIEDYVTREGIKFENKRRSGEAYYQPSTDSVVVPMASQYAHIAEYYSTTFHELTHSTMKKSRCDREAENKGAFFGNHAYSREELVAEIGAAMLCSRCGVATESAFKNSVAYLQSWIRALKNDPKMIVWASSRAEKAAKYIMNEAE